MKNRRILLIEDDETIVYGLTELLADEGFETVSTGCLREAFKMETGGFCLVLLDLGLPDGEGFDFLKWLCQKREKEKESLTPPVIILTAREEEAGVIKGLDMGADDYVTKPFKAGILLSRIRAVLRRQEKFSEAEDTLFCGNIVLDKRKTTVTAGGEKVELTAGEFRLLAYLMENKNRTLTRNALLSRLWDDEGDYVNDNTLTVTVGRLREKLGEQSRRFLKTVRGIGYQMEDCGD
ncbi:MAG: response regulator transcription factor [Lachnospiraceae bacterium]|nr:response regulator transcription factor [Lachnospiraceae bacterium]